MKKILFTSLIGLAIALVLNSCESDKDKRLKDLSPIGCQLIETYKVLQEDPENEKASMDLIGLRTDIEGGLEEDTGITIADLKEAMEDHCDNADLLEEAMSYDK